MSEYVRWIEAPRKSEIGDLTANSSANATLRQIEHAKVLAFAEHLSADSLDFEAGQLKN